jgi:GNAT superfamily N-acetyltransferase
MPAVRWIATGFGLLKQWPTQPDFLDCERTLGRFMVASPPDAAAGPAADGTVAAFGGTLPRGGITHLGDLFVDPRHQSGGAGRAVLDQLLDGTGARITFASADPRAVASYVRYGMVPTCPLYYLSGTAPGADRAAPAADPLDLCTVENVVAADAAASGGDRAAQLHWYARRPSVTVLAGGTGYVLAREVGGSVVLGPGGGTTPQACAAAVLDALRRYPGRPIRLVVFGVHPLLPVLLGLGFRITDSDTYLRTRDAEVPLDRYLPHPDLG